MQHESVAVWQESVANLESELAKLNQELADVQQRSKETERAILKHKKAEHRDKTDLVGKLKELEDEVRAATTRLDTATREKEATESKYHDAMNEYEALHDVVKAIKAEEQLLSARPNLEKVLEQESQQWADEEQAMRAAIQAGERMLKDNRKAQTDKIATLEARLKEQETLLASDRAQRRAEGWQGGGDEASATTTMSLRGQSRKRPSSTSVPLGDRTNAQH